MAGSPLPVERERPKKRLLRDRPLPLKKSSSHGDVSSGEISEQNQRAKLEDTLYRLKQDSRLAEHLEAR